jgi:hypothetical protein
MVKSVGCGEYQVVGVSDVEVVYILCICFNFISTPDTKTVGKNLNWDTRRISWSTYRASYADLRGDLSGATSDWTPVLRPRTSG